MIQRIMSVFRGTGKPPRVFVTSAMVMVGILRIPENGDNATLLAVFFSRLTIPVILGT